MALKQELEKQGNWLFKYRSILPIGILFIGLIVFIKTNLQEKALDRMIYYEFFYLLLSLLGLGIIIYTVGHTPQKTSVRNAADGKFADTLNTTGIYSIVRKPLYLGNFFMWLGPALMTENIWFIISFILFYWIYYERIILAEEQFLERKFGNNYRTWAEKVPVFIPKLEMFTSNSLSFSIKKVIKKEKNGLFAIFLIFMVFDLIGEWVKDYRHYNMISIIGCIVTMLIYIVLKIIKTRTSYLENNR
ncbi:methyltransferase family protein [Chryseobacterium sediminis]|uniref:DUF1295 domain-containing protein n=1 Tax=Chryseobacterium sediminis TaxID=1679494 RepID=A0A5B2U3P9_9FLAO|nr:isoprenylcysteine carboxylmethyltransferase family protein [Chryseobacterium sediminis]KAA2221172.1 DUF1295 domain-containing protein [Chryseobacterium sediminis]